MSTSRPLAGEQKADVKAAAQRYFEGLAQRNLALIPWAAAATLRTPLNPEGGSDSVINGRDAICRFFEPMLPALAHVETIRFFADEDWATGRALITLANGRQLHVCDVFHVVNGQIVEQENYYDPRPALE